MSWRYSYPKESDYDSLEDFYEAVEAYYAAEDQYSEEFYERTRC